MRKSGIAIGLASLLGCIAAQASADTAALILAGKTLAGEHCQACHQTFPGQKRPPPVAAGEDNPTVQAPTFMDVAARCLTDADLRDKIAMPHYPMREQWLETEEVDKLVAYIQSLGPSTACAVNP